MTCEKRYYCDLCKDRLPDYQAGIGVRWGDHGHSGGLRNVLISDSEHHLCNACCAALRAMFAEMDAVERARESRE